MEPRDVNIRAVIFDIYGTLLEVRPAPADADARWARLWHDTLGGPVRLSSREFASASDQVIAREHAAARVLGVQFPEVYWPSVATEVLPELAHLSDAARDEFLFQHAGLTHTVRLGGGAAETLRLLMDSGYLLGIASNCQFYTVRELDVTLAGAGLAGGIFTPGLCFRSFEHGFSKPDPHVFRLLAARLRAFGVTPPETLAVGDRLDNDIEPARAHGWQTWHLAPQVRHGASGGWQALRDWLQRQGRPHASSHNKRGIGSHG
jgi:putative hydrolase of the HAD superfamily